MIRDFNYKIFTEYFCLPISIEEESLKSVMINDLELPTEPSVLSEKENIEDSEKSESFAELYEKYDQQFIKNSTTSIVNESEEAPPQKRSSINDDAVSDVEENSKSIIEKLQTIDDPEVRKEFEQELNNNGKIAESDSQEPTEILTDYDPNYAQKVVNVTESRQEGRSDNEINSVHFNFNKPQLSSQVDDASKTLIEEITTVPTTLLRDTGFIEVFEQVFIHPTQETLNNVITDDPLNVQVDFDPIQIISESPDEFRNFDSGSMTVKFEEFSEPIIETTEQYKPVEIVTVSDETVYDTTAPTGISGKSIIYPNFSDETTQNKIAIDDMTTEVPTTFYEEPTTLPAFIESVTEIVEVNTEISVSFHIEDNEKQRSSASEKSSEEKSESSKSDEKNDKGNKSSSESSEENSAKEVLDTYELRILGVQNTGDHTSLMDDLYKDTMLHDVKKKDNPIVLLESIGKFTEATGDVQRNFNEENKIAQHLEEKLKPVEGKTFEGTTTGIYETFEDVITTIADGIELSKELRSSVNSFRSIDDESQTILDTNNEAVSSKNIKNALVNISEEMTMEDHAEIAEINIAVPVIAIGSVVLIIVLCVVIKRTLRSVRIL